ncbi:MAG: hypothetical protein KGM42_09885 [Hyphomicrobiales bacterium]|nr:hypothetical protein [Hyphomicrobiales bacterium]
MRRQFGASRGRLTTRFQSRGKFLAIGVQLHQGQIADNHSDVVVEIMRDAARELTERFELLRANQSLFCRLQLGHVLTCHQADCSAGA